MTQSGFSETHKADIKSHFWVLNVLLLCVLTSCPVLCVCFLPPSVLKEGKKFLAADANKEESLVCQGNVACLCWEKQNWLFGLIPAQVFFVSMSFHPDVLRRVFSSLSNLYRGSWTPPPQPLAALWPVTLPCLCHHAHIHMCIRKCFLSFFRFNLTII